MILVDTSIWIDHFRTGGSQMIELLTTGQVAMHDHVLGELALGSLRDRKATLEDLANLARAPLATEEEVRSLIESRRLFGRGIGYIDAHLLASAAIGDGVRLWTRDSQLSGIARELGVEHRA